MNEIEVEWTEQVFPILKQFQGKCRELGIAYEWTCTIGDEEFYALFDGKNHSEIGRRPSND